MSKVSKKSKQKGFKNFKKATIWDLPKIANLKNKPMGLSEDDEIIYS